MPTSVFSCAQNLFVSERRWIKVVAHVIRRLWDMDGTPENFASTRVRRQSTNTASAPAAAAAAAAIAAPFGPDFQQPPWRPAGGGRRGGAAAAPGGGGRRFSEDFRGEGLDATESFLTGLTADSRSDATEEWASAAAAAATAAAAAFGTMGDGDDDDDDGALLRAWEEEGESWVGAGRSLAWAPGEEEERRGGGGGGGDNEHDSHRGLSFDAPPRGSGAPRNPRLRGRYHRGGGDENGKEGTRPAGMWEVTPPAHVAALRRGRRQAGGPGGGRRASGDGPAYLRGVQSRIRPQLDAHKERLRKVSMGCLLGPGV